MKLFSEIKSHLRSDEGRVKYIVEQIKKSRQYFKLIEANNTNKEAFDSSREQDREQLKQLDMNISKLQSEISKIYSKIVEEASKIKSPHFKQHAKLNMDGLENHMKKVGIELESQTQKLPEEHKQRRPSK